MGNTIRKTMIVGILMMVAVLAFSESSDAKSKKKAALDAYARYLSQAKVNWGEYHKNVNPSEFSFKTLDMNNDRVPELILWWMNSDEASGPEHVYTYVDGKVKCITAFGHGEMTAVYNKKRIIRSFHMNRGIISDNYFRVGKSEVKFIFGEEENDLGTYHYYYIGNKKVSKKKYNAYKKKKLGSCKNSLKGEAYENTYENRKKHLSKKAAYAFATAKSKKYFFARTVFSSKKEKYVPGKIKIGKVTFAVKQKSEISSRYVIYQIINGKKKTIVKNVNDGLVTNGKYLYYVKIGKAKKYYGCRTVLYRMTLRTGKTRKIVKGENQKILDVKGRYVFWGKDFEADGKKLYSMNIKTHKSRFLTSGVGGFQIKYGRILTDTESGDVSNGPMCLFKLDGSGKIKLGYWLCGTMRNRHIYLVKVRYKKTQMYYKVVRMNLKGKNKKTIRAWSTTYPQGY